MVMERLFDDTPFSPTFAGLEIPADDKASLVLKAWLEQRGAMSERICVALTHDTVLIPDCNRLKRWKERIASIFGVERPA